MIKLFGIVVILFGMNSAFADSFTLVDDLTNEVYSCTLAGSSGAVDCVPRVLEVCTTAKGKAYSSSCYNIAIESCGKKTGGYASCVEATYPACISAKGSAYSSSCFNSVTESCK